MPGNQKFLCVSDEDCPALMAEYLVRAARIVGKAGRARLLVSQSLSFDGRHLAAIVYRGQKPVLRVEYEFLHEVPELGRLAETTAVDEACVLFLEDLCLIAGGELATMRYTSDLLNAFASRGIQAPRGHRRQV